MGLDGCERVFSQRLFTDRWAPGARSGICRLERWRVSDQRETWRIGQRLPLALSTSVHFIAPTLCACRCAARFVPGEGGQDIVLRCEKLTGGMVRCAGEWHSHTEGCSSDSGSTDVFLLGTVATRLAADGIPALMVIVSEQGVGVSLGEIREGS